MKVPSRSNYLLKTIHSIEENVLLQNVISNKIKIHHIVISSTPLRIKNE